jgi:uncharacterized OB-fold protein
MRFDLPAPDADTQPFWDGCKAGRFLVKRCADCGRASYYPRPFCPRCWSGRVAWEAASGRATLYTFSVVRVNDLPPWPDRVPYVAAIVELDEGPRAMTNVVDCPFEELRVGMPLAVTFTDIGEGVTIPQFRPASAA